MKVFILLAFILGSGSMVCFTSGLQENKGPQPNHNVTKSNRDSSSAVETREDEAGRETEQADTKNSVPSVTKTTDPTRDKNVMVMQEQRKDKTAKQPLSTQKKTKNMKGEKVENANPVPEANNDLSTPIIRQMDKDNERHDTPSDSKNTAPHRKLDSDSPERKHQEKLQDESLEISGVGLGANDPTKRPEQNNSTSPTIRQKAQAGDPAEEASECEDKQKVDMKQGIPMYKETWCVDENLEATNESQMEATLHNITNETNQSISSKDIKQEENITQPSNANELTQEQTTPTPEFCPTIWPECLRDKFEVSEVSKDLMTFTLTLFKKLSSSDHRPNVVVSPLSVSVALSNLMLGSGGHTREIMLNTLFKKNKDIGCTHEAIQNLTTHDSVISASNVFVKKGLNVTKEFESQSRRFYGSKFIQLVNDNKKNLKMINSWVSDKTKKLIPTLLQELPADLEMMLVNVIYYKGKWLSKFDPSNTREENFHPSSSSPVKVPMMNGHKYPLQNTNDQYLQAQVARFPLSDNCSLLIFLPQQHKPDALKKMIEKLNQEVVNTLMTQLEERPMKATSVSLPQLKLDTNLQLNDALSSIGLSDLFSYPNLCALTREPNLAVSDIHHRAVLEVKEEGVKAAAATTITVARTVSIFSVRRPFLFILVSDKSRVPIFIGRVHDPSQ